jgi:hypothetical protein
VELALKSEATVASFSFFFFFSFWPNERTNIGGKVEKSNTIMIGTLNDLTRSRRRDEITPAAVGKKSPLKYQRANYHYHPASQAGRQLGRPPPARIYVCYAVLYMYVTPDYRADIIKISYK